VADEEVKALITHLAARAMSVNDSQILWDEVVHSSYQFEMQTCPAAEAFANALIDAQDEEFWGIDGLAGDWTITEINGSYLDHLGVERNIVSHERYLSNDEMRLYVLAEAGRLSLKLINPEYQLEGFPPA
jgi:hypothetical protein